VTFEIRALRPDDREWVADTRRERWGSEIAVAHGVVYRPAELDGFLAVRDDRPVGVLTFAIEDDALEIVTIDAFEPRRGVGRALVEAARALVAGRTWLITTNDNVSAQRFYEAVGFDLVAVHEGAVERSRELKPEIPLIGQNGTPIRDELEYESRS
jgi:ribosomal protein S18 acetylase RimI-like enzyme